MINTDKIFAAALNRFLSERGAKARLAKNIGISPQYLGQIAGEKRYGDESIRRKIAEGLGFPGAKYEDFLEIGRAMLAGKEPPEPEPHYLTADEMSERGFFTVPFSDNMKLAAGGGGTIPIDEDVDESNIVVHGPSLGLQNNKGLQAFRVGGDSMEPLIADGGIVLADLKQSDIMHIHNGGIYVLCWDKSDGECAVKRLFWAEKNQSVIIGSEDKYYKPFVKPIKDIQLIGLVIWAWRQFRYK